MAKDADIDRQVILVTVTSLELRHAMPVSVHVATRVATSGYLISNGYATQLLVLAEHVPVLLCENLYSPDHPSS